MRVIAVTGEWHMRRKCNECEKTYPMYEKNHSVCPNCGTHPLFRVIARRTWFFWREVGVVEHVAAFFGVLKYPPLPPDVWEFRPLNNYWKEP